VRSSFCAAGDCIEVRESPAFPGRLDLRHVLQGTHPSGMGVSRAEWVAFVAGVKAGEFDHLTEPGR
jgi:hypothetical protein